MAIALALVLAWAISALLARPMAAMLRSSLQVRNYRGELIPTAMGLVLLFACLGSLTILALAGILSRGLLGMYAFWMTLVTLAGLVDDAVGNHRVRGFRGHFAALFRGELTSGMIKVFLVSGGALVLASQPLNWQSPVKLGVLILAVNLFNQLDLRPGRALKAFLLLIAVFVLRGSLVAAAGSGGALGLLPGDIRARYMLGDTGANLLGALVGLALLNLPSVSLLVGLAVLALGNLVGELLSFSRLIYKTRALHWLDKLGRRAGD